MLQKSDYTEHVGNSEQYLQKEGILVKRNLYDVFDEYSGDLPDIFNEKTNTKSIESLVMKKIKGKKKICRSRMIIIGIAAAIIAGGSITVSAVSKTGFFHKIISASEYASSENISLPMVQEDECEKMPDNFMFEQVAFSGSESCEIKLEGMYLDNSTAMMIISVKPDEVTNIPENSSAVAYFTLSSENGETTDNTEVMREYANAVYNEEDQKYYLTYYLTGDNFSGNSMNIEIKGIFTQDQISDCNTRLHEFQQELRTRYDAENMGIDEWKELWKNEKLDFASDNALRGYFEQSAGINGSWNTQIQLPDRSGNTIIYQNDGFSVIIDNLSVEVEYPENYESRNADIIMVELTDGTKISTSPGTNIEQILKQSGITEYSVFAFESGLKSKKSGKIMCYDTPHSPEDISSVTLYQAEDKPDGNLSKVCVLYEKNK